MLPEKCEFEVLTGFRPDNWYAFEAWSVRIVMPRTTKSGWTYAFLIRDRWLRSRRLDDRQISWGPAAPNGLQAGLALEPSNEQYATGQMVWPKFLFRNAGTESLTAAFPRIMTHSYYDSLQVVDDAGRDVPVEQDREVAGPVGWTEGVFLAPGGPLSEISGLAMAIGDMELPSGADAVIRAAPGQACRLRFTMSNYADPSAEPLSTGYAAFTISN